MYMESWIKDVALVEKDHLVMLSEPPTVNAAILVPVALIALFICDG